MCARTTCTPASSTTYRRRSAGSSGLSGTYIPPDLSTPRNAATASELAGRHTPTGVSAVIPLPRRIDAIWPARWSSSPYVTRRSAQTIATRSLAMSAISACAGRSSSGGRVPLQASMSERSGSVNTGRSAIRHSGSATAAASRVSRWPTTRSAVDRSNSDVRYSSRPAIPDGRGVSVRVRSKVAVPVGCSTQRTVTPGSRSRSSQPSSTANITCASGVRLGSRSGRSSLTSVSNGRS